MSTSLLITLVLTTIVLAAPQYSVPVQSCNISNVQLSLPPNRTAFSTPTGPLTSVVLGVGVQNYTCSAAGTYTWDIIPTIRVFLPWTCFLCRSIGAVASLYDLSCLSQFPEFDNVQDLAIELWKASPLTNENSPMTKSFMGNHFFAASSSGTGLSPIWDYRAGAAKGNLHAFVVAAKVADVPAPTSPQDVDWLQLNSVSGSLAAQVCAMSLWYIVPI